MHQTLAKKRQELARSTCVNQPQKQKFMQRRSTKDNLFSNNYGASAGISRSISTAIQLDDRIREQSARKLQRLTTRAGFFGAHTEANSLNNSTRRRNFGSTSVFNNDKSIGNWSSNTPTTIIRNMSGLSGMIPGLTSGMAPASQRLLNSKSKASFALPDCDLYQMRKESEPKAFDFETRAQSYRLFGRGYHRNQLCFCIAFLFQPEMRPNICLMICCSVLILFSCGVLCSGLTEWFWNRILPIDSMANEFNNIGPKAQASVIPFLDIKMTADNLIQLTFTFGYILFYLGLSGVIFSVILIAQVAISFREERTRLKKEEVHFAQKSINEIKATIRDYYKKNPLGPSGRIQGIVWLRQCSEVRKARLGTCCDDTEYHHDCKTGINVENQNNEKSEVQKLLKGEITPGVMTPKNLNQMNKRPTNVKQTLSSSETEYSNDYILENNNASIAESSLIFNPLDSTFNEKQEKSTTKKGPERCASAFAEQTQNNVRFRATNQIIPRANTTKTTNWRMNQDPSYHYSESARTSIVCPTSRISGSLNHSLYNSRRILTELSEEKLEPITSQFKSNRDDSKISESTTVQNDNLSKRSSSGLKITYRTNESYALKSLDDETEKFTSTGVTTATGTSHSGSSETVTKVTGQTQNFFSKNNSIISNQTQSNYQRLPELIQKIEEDPNDDQIKRSREYSNDWHQSSQELSNHQFSCSSEAFEMEKDEDNVDLLENNLVTPKIQPKSLSVDSFRNEY